MGHTHNLLRYNVIMGIMGIMGIFWIMLGCYNVKMGVRGIRDKRGIKVKMAIML